MKKIISIMLMVIIVLSFTSCGLKDAIKKNEEDKDTLKNIETSGEVASKNLSKGDDNGDKTDTSPKVYAGDHHSLVIKSDGSLWAWGSNVNGQLGNGQVTTYKERNIKDKDNDQPKPIKVMEDVICASAGTDYSLAVTNKHELYGWGNNGSSQLGIEGIRSITKPMKIMDDVIYVETGGCYSAVIKEDNSLWVFGRNYSDQNGFYTDAVDFTPVPTKLLENIKDVSLSDYYGMALTLEGTLYMWGSAQYLGEAYSADQNAYIKDPVIIMDNVASISGDYQTPMIITNTGDLYAWGFNGSVGSLGTGTDEFYVVNPQLVIEDVKEAISCNGVNMAIMNDQSLWIWGGIDGIADFYDREGYVGGSVMQELVQYGNKPVKIMEDVISANGNFHIFAIDADNNLWGWGRNQFGLIGDGTVTTYDYNIIEDGEFSEYQYYILENNEKTQPTKVMNLDK